MLIINFYIIMLVVVLIILVRCVTLTNNSFESDSSVNNLNCRLYLITYVICILVGIDKDIIQYTLCNLESYIE